MSQMSNYDVWLRCILQTYPIIKIIRSLWIADLSKVTVAVDVLFLVTVLQLVVFNVEPESLHDAGTRLCVHTQQTGQTGVQFVLRRLGTDSNHSMEATLAENARKSSS